jgi:hypothetical protein
MEETAKAPFWKPVLIYGAILGFISILLSVIFYVTDLMMASWVQWVNLLFTIVALSWCMVAYRNEYLGGYASFGKIFVMALVSGIFAIILSSIFSFILFEVIDPDLIDKMKLAAEERVINNPRVPESMQEEMIERVTRNMERGRMMIMGLIGGTVMYAILGLIIAAFVKKEKDVAPEA